MVVLAVPYEGHAWIDFSNDLQQRVRAGLFVGDHPDEDYAPAQRHGMTPLLIDRHNRPGDKPNLTRIRRLTQLPQILNDGLTAAVA